MTHQNHQGFILKTLLENPELLLPPKTDDNVNGCKESLESAPVYNSQSAFLGPNIWSNNSSGGFEDFNFEYMDLEEFLAESDIAVNGDLFGDVGSETPSLSARTGQNRPQTNSPTPVAEPSNPGNICALSPSTTGQPSTPHRLSAPHTPDHPDSEPVTHDVALEVDPAQNRMESVLAVSSDVDQSPIPPQAIPHRDSTASVTSIVPINISFKERDLALANVPGQDNFDPCVRTFSEDELRPQPMIKKSTKMFVPDDHKDDKYWFRRKKNNVAAKRSRDARRIKENQITLRAAFLEKQNDCLHKELASVVEENRTLREKLAKYETASP